MSQTTGTLGTDPRRQPVPAPTGRVDGHVTLPRVVASEWLKLRSLRSTPLVILAAMAAMVVFGAIIGHNTRHPAGLDPEDVAASGPLQGYYLGQLLIGALGVLVVSGEYSSGMIRATFSAVPRRLPVLVAKVLVFTVVVAIAMVLASVVGSLVAQAFLSGYRPTYSLSDPDVLRVVVGTGVYLTLIGLLGGAIGWIVRSTPGALVALFAVILVLPVLLLLFPRRLGPARERLATHRRGSSLLDEPAHAQRARPVDRPGRDAGLGGRGLRRRRRAVAPPRRLGTRRHRQGWILRPRVRKLFGRAPRPHLPGRWGHPAGSNRP